MLDRFVFDGGGNDVSPAGPLAVFSQAKSR
jgi:hypothetical protein